jgi:hypothetical protein
MECTVTHSEDTWCTWRNRVACLPVTNPAASVGSSHGTLTFPLCHNSEEQRATSIFRVIESVLYPEMNSTAHQILFG